MIKLTRRHFLATLPLLAGARRLGARDGTQAIFDLHQHVFYQGRSNDQLIAHQAYNGVTLTNLLPGDGWMLSELAGNADCLALEMQHPGQFIRFACADPIESRMLDVGGIALGGPIEEMSSRKQGLFGASWPSPALKLRAFGLGQSQNGRRATPALGIGEMKFHVAVDSPEMDTVYGTAEEFDVPVLLHFQDEYYNLGIERLEQVLKAYPKVNFIGHAQTWWGNISADLNPSDLYPKGPIKPGGLIDRLLADYPNIFGDLSAESGLNAMTRDPEFAQGFVHRHSRKLIWGSDCECRDGKGGGTPTGYCIAARCLAALRKLVPGPATFHTITYENGINLLKLKRNLNPG